MRRVIAILMALTLSSCIIFYPRKEVVYDEQCRIMVKHSRLEAAVVEDYIDCHDEECLVFLVGSAAIGATSFVISGSITIIANVIYWIEKESKC